MKKFPKWIFIIAGIFLLILCGIIGTCVAGEIKNTGDMPNDPNINRTQIASTILASRTETVQANATSIPEAAATIEPNTDLTAYTTMQSEKVNQCAQINDALLFSFDQASTNISLLQNQAFLDEMNKELDQHDLYCTNFYQENVPIAMVQVNDYLRQADEEFQLFLDNVRYGLQNYDVNALITANTHMTSGNYFLQLATTEIEKFSAP